MINNLHHCPLQFNLGELSTMSTIYDTNGEGRSKVPNIERYFRSDNPCDDNIARAPITTSHQYKENLILLMTVFEIKKIVLGKNMQKFWMRCFMKSYEWGNNAICKRHLTLFKDKKDHYYSFGPSDELVQTLPYEFVDNLKGGAYTKLPSKWMSREIWLHQYNLWEVYCHPIIYVAFFHLLLNLQKDSLHIRSIHGEVNFFYEPWTNIWNNRWWTVDGFWNQLFVQCGIW